MKTYSVVITEVAYAKIREQVRYIALEGESPQNAERWLDRAIAAVQSLEQMPRRCPLAIESAFRPFEIHQLLVDGYLFLFTVNDLDETVTVMGGRHGRQLPNPEDLSNTMN